MSVKDLKGFQDQVSELLLRHRSLLDVLSKYQQSNSTVNRSVIKAITECGCIEVEARKQPYDEDSTGEQMKGLLNTHVKGGLCDQCQEIIEVELGKNLFYMSALCNHLNIDLNTVLEQESKKCQTLGFFNMS
jgi:NTP pyrophosphatase (non-canonical NTP hydrolase)